MLPVLRYRTPQTAAMVDLEGWPDDRQAKPDKAQCQSDFVFVSA